MNTLIQFHKTCLEFYQRQKEKGGGVVVIREEERKREREEFKRYFREQYKDVSEENIEGFYQAYWAYLDDIAGTYIDLLEGEEQQQQQQQQQQGVQ